MTPAAAKPDLDELIGLFYARTADLGQFAEVCAAEMPAVYQGLLAHQNHMTVTVERFHQSPVDVRVLETSSAGPLYSRRILLARQTDGVVVQFGIVRLNFDHLGADVRREVESQRTPLGRVLIAHGVLREVHLTRLWKVTPTVELLRLFGLPGSQTTFGRTAVIDCNGEPAIELLEIVAPAAEPASG